MLNKLNFKKINFGIRFKTESKTKLYNKNKNKIDFMIYTDYSANTDEKVYEIVNNILKN